MGLSKLKEPKQTRSLEERYEMLRKTLAHYLLLQVGTFVALAGFDAIGPAMGVLTGKKAELKGQEIKEEGQEDRVGALCQDLAQSRGETFDSDYDIETGNGAGAVGVHRWG